MTRAKPLTRYRAIEGALASGLVTAQLHHLWGHDQRVGVAGEVWHHGPGLNMLGQG